MSEPERKVTATGVLRDTGSLLFSRDRWMHTVAFLLAAAAHIPILMMGGHQYLRAASHPESANQAVERVQPMLNDQGKPIQFVYVKDAVPAPQKREGGAPASDMDRIGASPDPRKGDSPEPTNRGSTAIRQSGGPGEGADSRPAARPTAASPKTEQPRAAAPGAEWGREAQGRPRTEREVARAAQETAGPDRGVKFDGRPVKGENGLPIGGDKAGGERPEPRSGAPSADPAVQPRPGRQGLGTQLQEMSAGALQRGFNNPNASRLNTGDLSFDTAGWDLGPYARKVQERVQSNWRTPEAQMVLRQKGWVAVHFNVQKDGQITELQVVRSSGIPSYDQSAMDALRSSNPLPPLPDMVTAPQLGALFRFFYNMPTGE